MEENSSVINFEEVRDDEINDIWDIFFPKAAEKKERAQRQDMTECSKPRRYLKFLTI